MRRLRWALRGPCARLRLVASVPARGSAAAHGRDDTIEVGLARLRPGRGVSAAGRVAASRMRLLRGRDEADFCAARGGAGCLSRLASSRAPVRRWAGSMPQGAARGQRTIVAKRAVKAPCGDARAFLPLGSRRSFLIQGNRKRVGWCRFRSGRRKRTWSSSRGSWHGCSRELWRNNAGHVTAEESDTLCRLGLRTRSDLACAFMSEADAAAHGVARVWRLAQAAGRAVQIVVEAARIWDIARPRAVRAPPMVRHTQRRVRAAHPRTSLPPVGDTSGGPREPPGASVTGGLPLILMDAQVWAGEAS